jgi:uncharacterized protein (DUF924 family)
VNIDVLEFWEKPLDFMQYDWAAVELAAESSATIHFMTMYGEIYHQAERAWPAETKDYLASLGFELFVPTPGRLQLRGPHQLSSFTLAAAPQPERIHLRP